MGKARSDRDRDVRKFRRAADQRLTAASFLLEHGFHLESTYLAGYVVECAIKALILSRTPRSKYTEMVQAITRVGAKGHDIEYLKGVLKRPPVNCSIPRDMGEMISRVASWTTDLRYEVGLTSYEDASEFLAAAETIRNWAARS